MKLKQGPKPKAWLKPPIVNQQRVVYSFLCDLCDADYVGYTVRHLHQRIVEHKNSAIGKHLVEAHGQLGNLKESQFRILRKCQTKFECLIYEMLFIKEINPSLNTQADSIRAKLFIWTDILTLYISFLMMHCLSSIYTLKQTLIFWLDNDVSWTSKRSRFLTFLIWETF